ncbi:hypothetical protein PF004_g13017 [Phytophthora fragariae]|uniref:Methyltransferase-like protein 4 n=1 Tax=Phytophthora fragariae TaxID=53985 RepID=A0A6G0NTI6_9STRA|nr:hypothetical protein PF004_g13017 [Phytophthora fragariae]
MCRCSTTRAPSRTATPRRPTRRARRSRVSTTRTSCQALAPDCRTAKETITAHCAVHTAYPPKYLDTIKWMHAKDPSAEILLTEDGNELWFFQSYTATAKNVMCVTSQFHHSESTMEPKVSSVNHAALVNGYYMGQLRLREDSLQAPATAFIRPSIAQAPGALSAAAARRHRKRETAARRRSERLVELTAQGKFVPLSDQARNALQVAFERVGGPRFALRDFLPSFQDHSDVIEDVFESLPAMTDTGPLDDGNLHYNATDQVRVSVANGTKVLLPAGSSFAQRDVREIHRLPLGRHKLIVMDPPWQNKSVSRAKRYDMFDHTELLKIQVAQIADLDECILAVWVTNRPRYMAYLRDQALPAWGFTYHASWYWLKLSKNGELVTPLDSSHRLPVETLVVAYRAKDPEHEQRLLQRLGKQTRIVLSIPLRHSWKPPPECFFDEKIIPASAKKAELFARELRPSWTSIGNEVFKFQAANLFQPPPSNLDHENW